MIAFPLYGKASLHAARGRGTHLYAGVLAALAGALAIPGLALAQDAKQDISGLWVTEDGDGAIDIRPCGDQRCGRIAWMKEPKGPDGKPPVDVNNPDPNLRARRICGLQIINGLKAQADGTWADGRVYNPDNGKTYGMKMRREGADTLKAHGYLGFELLGQTQEWRRAPKNLGTCEEAAKRS